MKSAVGFLFSFLFFAASFAHAEYYAEVKAWKKPGLIPRPGQSHHYVRVWGEGEVYDISFLPEEKFMRRNGGVPLRREWPSRNLTQEQSDALGNATGKIIRSSGVIPIAPETFYRAREQSLALESGSIPYRFFGHNCVTAATEANGPFRTGTKFGPRLIPSLVENYTQGYVESQYRRPGLFGRR